MSRKERLATMIKKEVSEIIFQKVSDPRIGFVSITAVDLSPDLKNANIFVSVFGNDKQKNDAMLGLTSATAFIRAELSQLLSLRQAPLVKFVRDDSLERGSRVLDLISKIDHENKNISSHKKSLKKK